MALQISFPGTDSTSQITKAISIPSLVWSTDWAVTNRGTSDCKLANLTTPLDATETVLTEVSNIRDIYANSGIDRSMWATSHQGRRIHRQININLIVTDTNDPSYRVVLPFPATVQLRAPVHPLIDSTICEAVLARAVATFYEESDTSVKGHFGRLLFGATVPEAL
jgi:hypothetical protein